MIDAIIVIYNKKIEDSITFSNIKNDSRLRIIIYDNSTLLTNNYEYARDNNLQYYSSGQNDGLSKAYNYVIENTIKDINSYYIILDDDTNIPNEYIDNVIELIKKNYDIILPVVYSNNSIISPCKVSKFGRIKKVKGTNMLKNLNEISAINSGMVIKKELFNNIKYDERLFLDYVDHMFMKKVRENKFKIAISTIPLMQNFSRDQKGNVESAKARFKIFKSDFKIYCKEYNNVFLYYISLNKLRFRCLLKYKRVFW